MPDQKSSDIVKLLEGDDALPPVSTGAEVPVRTVYARAAPFMSQIFRDFGYELSAIQTSNMSILMRAIECVDRYVDEMRDDFEAWRFIGAVMHALCVPSLERQRRGWMLSGAATQPLDMELPFEVRRALLDLRQILYSDRAPNPHAFFDMAREVLRLSRQMRLMRDTRERVAAALHEGELVALMVTHVMDVDEFPLSHSVVSFFVRVGALGNICDDYLDMDRDYLDGKTLIPPSIAYKTRLALTIAMRGIELFFLHPNKQRMLEYASLFLKRVGRS